MGGEFGAAFLRSTCSLAVVFTAPALDLRGFGFLRWQCERHMTFE